MAESNGNNKTSVWIAILISAIGAAATFGYGVAKASFDNTNARLDKLEAAMGKIDDKITVRLGDITKELSFRVDKANDEHKNYDIRLDRLETRVSKLR